MRISPSKLRVWLTLEQHQFELHWSTYTQILFFFSKVNTTVLHVVVG